jgi:hypothetical protein
VAPGGQADGEVGGQHQPQFTTQVFDGNVQSSRALRAAGCLTLAIPRLSGQPANLYVYASPRLGRTSASAAERVERWLAERGDLDGLRGRIDVGDEDVARRLAELLIDPSYDVVRD